MNDENPYTPGNQPIGFPGSPGDPTTSGLAVTSLILGIVSIPLIFVCIGWITALIAVVFGIIALVKIGDSKGRVKGKGMAIAGFGTAAFAVVVYAIFVFWIARSEMGEKGGLDFLENLQEEMEKAVEEAGKAEAE